MEEPEDVVPQESCPVNRKDEGAIYSPARLSDEVIRMETGLPDKAMFSRVVWLVQRLEGSIVYAAGWRVEGMTMESQVFMALMKVRQNYTQPAPDPAVLLQHCNSSKCGENFHSFAT
ncbi:unnamed protein product [Gadus morhua 'NCC']